MRKTHSSAEEHSQVLARSYKVTKYQFISALFGDRWQGTIIPIEGWEPLRDCSSGIKASSVIRWIYLKIVVQSILKERIDGDHAIFKGSFW